MIEIYTNRLRSKKVDLISGNRRKPEVNERILNEYDFHYTASHGVDQREIVPE